MEIIYITTCDITIHVIDSWANTVLLFTDRTVMQSNVKRTYIAPLSPIKLRLLYGLTVKSSLNYNCFDSRFKTSDKLTVRELYSCRTMDS